MEDSSNWFMSIWNLESDDLDEHMEGSNGTGEESDDLDEHLEDTKGIEEETLYDCALFNGKPYRELTTEDLHGVAFKTIEDVESFYSYYSLAMGFSVRKFKLDWNASGTVIIRRSLVCSKQGARKESGKARPVNEVEELRGSLNAGNQHKKSVVKDCQPTQKRKKQCRKLSRLDRFIDHFANCRRIFIPMHEPLPTNELDGHWLLLLVHVPDRSVEILDSAPDPSKTISRQRDARAVLNMLDRIYGDSKFRQANKLFAFGTLPFKANGTGPRQKNDFDCGVYVIRNMQKYGTDWAAKYNLEIERASLVVECLRHPKNKVVDLHVRVDRCLARNTGK